MRLSDLLLTWRSKQRLLRLQAKACFCYMSRDGFYMETRCWFLSLTGSVKSVHLRLVVCLKWNALEIRDDALKTKKCTHLRPWCRYNWWSKPKEFERDAWIFDFWKKCYFFPFIKKYQKYIKILKMPLGNYTSAWSLASLKRILNSLVMASLILELFLISTPIPRLILPPSKRSTSCFEEAGNNLVTQNIKKAKLIHIWSTDSPAGQVCTNLHGHNFRDTLFVEVSCNRLYVLQTEISVLEKIIELLTRLLSTLAKERSKLLSSWM